MKKRISRNDPCPCGSGKKFEKCHYTDHGVGVIEIINYPEYGENVCGVFMFVPETHMLASTGDLYKVHIYSSVRDLLENNYEVKQTLVNMTCRLLCPGVGDAMFVRGATHGLPDDILIWHNVREQHMMWFTVTQAKSYFGPCYEPMFGEIEHGPWSRAEEAVSNG